MWKTLVSFWAQMSLSGNILPLNTGQIHSGAIGLTFLRKPWLAEARISNAIKDELMLTIRWSMDSLT
jgi:hypothetical protein